MAERIVHTCQCPDGVTGTDHPHRVLHRQMNLLLSRLNEQQRRWFAALESKKVGHGGDTRLSLITGLHVDTIRRGREELDKTCVGGPPSVSATPAPADRRSKKRSAGHRGPDRTGRTGYGW